MFSWEHDFKSHRVDGRVTGSLGALYARLHDMEPVLAYKPEVMQEPGRFREWQAEVKTKLEELLRMPSEEQPQPAIFGNSLALASPQACMPTQAPCHAAWHTMPLNCPSHVHLSDGS